MKLTFLKVNILIFLISFLSQCSKESKKTQNDNVSQIPDTTVIDSSNSNKTPNIPIEFTKDRFDNDLARYLAGMSPKDSSNLLYLDSLDFVQKHKSKFDKLFIDKENRFLAPLRKWAKKSEAEFYENDQNVFYPFSGADFLTIHNLYPNAKNYILFGLEPEGLVPDFKNIPNDKHDSSLVNLTQTIVSLIGKSYFITNDMAPDLAKTDYKGILPVMLVFIARSGQEVLEIQHIKLNNDGKIEKIYVVCVDF